MGTVFSDIEMLKKAQEFDGQLYDIGEELKTIPVTIAGKKKEWESEKAHLAELEDSVKKLQLKQKEKEGQLAEKETHVKKLDGQLTQVKTNKEYGALQQEIASLKADNSLLEEDIIKILDEVEAARETVKIEKSRLAQIEKQYQEIERKLKDEEKILQASRENLKKQREEVTQQLKPDIRQLYERILSAKEGHALAALRKESCSACSMHLRPQLINNVLLGESLVLCESCSRILYVEQEPSQKAAQ